MPESIRYENNLRFFISNESLAYLTINTAAVLPQLAQIDVLAVTSKVSDRLPALDKLGLVDLHQVFSSFPAVFRLIVFAP